MFLKRHRTGILEIISLPERLDASTAEPVRDELRKIVDAGSLWLLLNVSAVDFIDSSGLSVFISVLKQVRVKNGDVALFGVNSRVRALLEFTRVHRILEVYDDESSAVRVFGSKNHS
jgi:anti-sigma B factor antagonist